MDDKKELDDLKSENEDLKRNNSPYKCAACGDRVNFTYILPFLRATGLCPNCWEAQ